MSSVTVPATTAKHSRPLSCSLTLAINGQPYDVTIFKAEAAEVGRVFHLEKPGGDSYDVSEHAHGPECTCPDFECRRRGLDSLGCKHIRSLRALGLMLEPRQTAVAAPQSVPGVGTAETPASTLATCCEATEAPCAACAGESSESFADELAAVVGPIAPTADDLAEMHRCHVERDAESLGIIPTEANPADWPAWTDEDVWEPIDDAPDSLLTLDALIDHEADAYRKVGTLAGEMIARHLAELASMVRLVQAHTPHQAADRIATLERDSRLRGE